MPTTSNFGWTTPADTDLVKDGAAAIRTLGNGVDASLVDLKGGTTGQILSKATNTDLDYTWVTPNVGDITEVQAGVGISIASGTGPIPVITNSSTDLITTAGDLLYGSAADTVARLGIGTAGQLLAVNSGATAPEWVAAPSSGGMTLLASGAHSGTTLTLSSIATTYNYLVVFFDSFDPGNDEGLRMRVNNDSNTRYHSAASVSIGAGNFSATSWAISPINDDAVITNNLVITIPNYAQANGWKMAIADGLFVNQTTTTSFNYERKIGLYNQTTAITELNFFESGGNSFAVNYKLYGVK